jgi:hypothetical protein
MSRTTPLLLCLALLIVGCAAPPTNPSFPITDEQADKDLSRIVASRKPLDRPLIIVGGFIDPGIAGPIVRMRYEGLTTDKRIIDVELGTCLTFNECRLKVIDAVDRAFPSADPMQTVPVDVIGLSMGGLASRYAALPTEPGHMKRLQIVRLFTVGSPLNGAKMANEVPGLLPMIEPMRTGSKFVRDINSSEPGYPVFSYVRLGDNPVGVSNAALPGHRAWWLSTPPMNSAHIGAFVDPRITADIVRRLRGETPFSTEPPAPAPVGPWSSL